MSYRETKNYPIVLRAVLKLGLMDKNSVILKAKEITFSSDGIISLSGKPLKYKWIDNKHIQIDGDSEDIYEVTINDKNLLLKHEKSKTNEEFEVVFIKAEL